MSSKNKLITKEVVLSELVLNNYLLIIVLERFGIELGQRQKTIETICLENKISINAFLTVINLYSVENFNHKDTDFSVLEIKTILAYLKTSHQYYSKEIFPEIIDGIKNLSLVNMTPEVSMVKQFFNQYKEEVKRHFDYEEKILFPYIQELLKSKKIKSLDFSIKQYRDDHDDIEEKLGDIKRLLIQYLAQKNDTLIRRKILFALFLLEQDLKIHDYIEDKILIPYIVNKEKGIV